MGGTDDAEDTVLRVVREILEAGDPSGRAERAAGLLRGVHRARGLLAAELDTGRAAVPSPAIPPPAVSPTAGPRPPSIRDVAAAAGVSYQTVSRVINDAPRVRPETRELVRATIAALGFRPNRTAQALGTGRSRGVTVVASDTVLYGPAATIRGVEQAARRAGRSVGIRFLDSDDPSDLDAAVDDMADAASGFVVVIAFEAAGQQVFERLPAHIPAVAALDPGVTVPAGRLGLALDERTAAAAATAHLLELGHRTVHHIAIPSEDPATGRQAGWRQALVDAGAAVPPVVTSGWGAVAAREAAARLLAASPAPTAVLCGNDDVAAGVQRALHEAGLVVPDDVSLIGFDDTPSAAVSVPALTTVAMDFEALGRVLTAAVTGDAVTPPDALPVPRLVVRESTAPPRVTIR